MLKFRQIRSRSDAADVEAALLGRTLNNGFYVANLTGHGVLCERSLDRILTRRAS